MKKIRDYSVLEVLSESEISYVCRARRSEESDTCVIKKLKKSRSSRIDVARFRQEYENIINIDDEGIIRVFDCIDLDDEIAIVMEDFNGVHLKSIILSETFEVVPFLRIAISLSATLGNLHLKNIVHKDIKPYNIMVRPGSGEVKITNFGISRLITHIDEDMYDPRVIGEILVYMSPEQTGRMNCPVDYRSDLYSLGITFYEMLTGLVPFMYKDPMEIIYSHIAHRPVPPSRRNGSIPEILSGIILKLLSKNVDERYQNAYGLMADLEECLRQSVETGRIEAFELGSHDTSITFNIPQKFFGRGSELEIIMAAFERVCRTGRKEITLVAGNPGIGKSALIDEINKPMTGRRGYFISGKYDQFRKDVPYSAVIQAFAGLVRQILTENRNSIDRWRDVLIKGLGSNGKIITDIVPAMELIIGKQPDVSVLGPDESNNRFILVFNNFVRTFASSEHPLVIFLDDLQWVDLASLSLFKNIAADPESRYIYFIGSYRDNEVSETHPLMMAIDDLRREKIEIHTITLGPLDVKAVNQLVSGFLRNDENTTLPLSGLIHKKTNGNPFFINQFLKMLYDKKIISLAPVEQYHRGSVNRSGWSWDIDRIMTMRVTDNVVELMTERIFRLPEESGEILKIAACIGSWFDLLTLSRIQDVSIDTALSRLSGAIDEGLVVPRGQVYAFYHDRIQEAAYSLIPDGEKAMFHYRIGRLLLQNTDKKDINEKLLYIVNQLNEGKGMIHAESERLELARFNLASGIKAKSSAAYRSALHYFTIGIEMINCRDSEYKESDEKGNNSCWDSYYDLLLSLYSEAVESAYLCAEYEEMNSHVDAVLANARDIFDKTRVYESIIRKLVAQNRGVEAISTGLGVLKTLNVWFPESESKLYLVSGFLKIRLSLLGRSSEDVYNMPVMKDQKILLIMRFLNSISSSVYWGKPWLLPLIVFKFVSFSLKYGNGPYSAYSYAGYGLMLCSVGDIETGYSFGKMSLRLLEKLDVRDQKSRTMFVYNIFIRHWKEHTRETLPGFLEGYKHGLETGDLEFAFHNSMAYCAYGFLIGREISEHKRETGAYTSVAESSNQKSQLHIFNLYGQIMANLRSESAEPYILEGPVYDEAIMLPRHISAADYTAISAYYLNKFMLLYLFHEYRKSLIESGNCEKHISALAGQLGTGLFYFYNSLLLLALCTTSPGNEKREYLGKVNKNLKRLKKWAGHVPQNYLHKYNLVKAERARVRGEYLDAEILYEISIEGARENEYINEQALACECAAYFYIERNMYKIAGTYMADAVRCYTLWGAAAKVKQLREKYPDFIPDKPSAVRFAAEGDKSGNTAKSLDISTVIKASQMLSSEIHLDRFLKKMLGFVMENAGAERGLLIMEKNGRLVLEAEGRAGGEITVLQSIPVDERARYAENGDANNLLPYSIINYIAHTGENLVLHDAAVRSSFTSDPYITKNRVRSLLCAPIVDKGKITGILYLENNLTAGAFTPERIALLNVLSAQAAISMENARLVTVETDKAAMDREIEMAKNIQESLLPRTLPCIENAHIAFKYVPMTGVGGDFVNIKYKEDAGKLGLFICDVSGHGVPAAMTASIISVTLDFYWDDFIDDPASIFMKMQNFLAGKLGGNFFTACLCVVDLESGKLTVSSAGHPKIIIVKNDGKAWMAAGKGRLMTDFLMSTSTNEVFHLDHGDRMVLYTDGITEAENPWKEMLGTDDHQYCALIGEQSRKSASPEELCANIYNMVIDFTGSMNPQDDITVLVCEYKKHNNL